MFAKAKESCESPNESVFIGEVAIHFTGVEGLNRPIVWVFPEITICLNCGMARFVVPDSELGVLRTGPPVEGAQVWLGLEDDKC
jgi:hypothetical protein